MSQVDNLATNTSDVAGDVVSPVSDIGVWFQKYGLMIGGIVAVVAVIIGGYYWYTTTSSTKETEAGVALSRVKPYFEASDWQKALDGDATKKVRDNAVIGLRTIVEEYGSTNAGKTASLMAGNALLQQQKFDEAVSYFEKASSSDSPVVMAGGYAGLAACSEAKQDYVSALTMYEKILGFADQTGAKDRYLYVAGLCAEKAQDKQKAENYFRNILSEFESSEFSGEAKSGLVRIGTLVE